MDPPLRSRKQTKHCGMEISDAASQKDVQNSTVSGKVVLAFFWVAQRSILEHYQESSTTVNSVH
jgi:hypothetical protein